MKLCVNQMLYAISYALDCVEREVFGTATINHSKRVSCIATFIGKKIGLSNFQVLDLTTCALLHDNALTEYLNDEKNKTTQQDTHGNYSSNLFISHCIKGEENMNSVPTYEAVTNVVKYHHEHADGTGTFGLTEDEIPLYSKIIHLADQLDVLFNFNTIDEAKLEDVCTHLEKTKGSIYATTIADVFIKHVDVAFLAHLSADSIDEFLQVLMPEVVKEYNMDTIINLVDVFVRIIDYKSEFTQAHTTQLTQKALYMCNYYGYDENTTTRFYMAAGLHDIGKLVVDTKILEKPDKLTDQEFEHIKTHADYTYQILSKINHIEDILQWASFHHEKLNGKGYPFGKSAEQLDDKCRLMACLDIYQALREQRSYKVGFSHEKAIEILRKMVADGFIDATIVDDLNTAFGALPQDTVQIT